jgi:CheY-like chemotaxis protein
MRLWGRRVLAVDDDADTLEVVSEVLQQVGAEVVAVGAPQHALPTVVSLMPDVLVVDVAMPQQDGVSLIRRLRELPAGQGGRIPALTLTAVPATAALRAEWLAAGFQRHLAKPFDPEELVRLVVELAGHVVDRRRLDLPPDQWPADVLVDRRQPESRYQRGPSASSDSASSEGRGRAK